MLFVDKLDDVCGGHGTGSEGQIPSVSRIGGSFRRMTSWRSRNWRQGQIQSMSRIREAHCLTHADCRG
jgi:hypothetical protein